jgi:hypothetical protein
MTDALRTVLNGQVLAAKQVEVRRLNASLRYTPREPETLQHER